MAVYQTGVIIVTLFIMGFLFVVQFAVVDPLRTAIATDMTKYDVVNSTYPNFVLADTFMYNIWLYLLVFVVMILAYWLYVYSQRKGAPIY